MASQVALVIKSPPANAGAAEEGSAPGLGRPPGEGHGNPPRCSCLENSTHRGARWATVHGVAKGPTQLSDIAHARLSTRRTLLQEHGVRSLLLPCIFLLRTEMPNLER